MDKIPLTFEYKGKPYSGHFHTVAGAGSTQVRHLMIDNYYRGRYVIPIVGFLILHQSWTFRKWLASLEIMLRRSIKEVTQVIFFSIYLFTYEDIFPLQAVFR